MPDFVDTSVTIRYLTGDPPEMAVKAAQLIEKSTALYLTETAIGETAFVLRRVYGLSRVEVVDLIVDLLQRENIYVHNMDKGITITALLRCRPSGRVSIGDALIWAAVRDTGPSVVYSFDRRFPADGIELREP